MKNILLRGGPGTGKTFISRAMAYYICKEKLEIDAVYRKDIHSDYDDIEKFIKSEYVEFIQVHPSSSYEDIVYGMEVCASGEISMQNTEKRIKALCDRAIGKSDLYCIILDDIDRANSGALLGNLLYGMEYRNQPINLIDGNTLIIPDNVFIIFTESNQYYGTSMEYALRRRMEYVKELISDRDIIDRYYDTVVTTPIKNIILDVYDAVRTFVYGSLLMDLNVQKENYIPGHGMFIVDRKGSQNDILIRVKLKLKYQVFPYIKELYHSGLITGDIDTFFLDTDNKINLGKLSSGNVVKIEKYLYKSNTKPPVYSLQDSKQYYENTIIPNNCKEHRGIIENIIDAIILNNLFPYDMVLADLLRNTNIVKFEDRNRPGNYAAYIIETSKNLDFGYLTTVSNNIRSYYSSNPVRTGRWSSTKEIPGYKVTLSDGTSKDYMYLNAFRNTGFDVKSDVIHAIENTASIYCAVYRLVYEYLNKYMTNMMMIAASDLRYSNIYNLAVLEKRYFELLNDEVQEIRGSEHKLFHMCSKITMLRTLWTMKDDTVEVDYNKFNNLVSGKVDLTVDLYEDIYNITGTSITINIEGVRKMTDLRDYQQIMNNIGVRQMIFQGPPGTSKTFESKRFVLKQLEPASSIAQSNIVSQSDISRELLKFKLTDDDYNNPSSSTKLKTGGWDLVQFHPSYGYEDFIRGIDVKPVGGVPTYSSVNRILGKIAEFAKIAENAANTKDTPKFYLIIDEINRANLATVFGELIYGLEYRNSEVSTPYEVTSKISGNITKDIVLGENLFIIGTMNTADKSIDAIDYAIRRRFIFIDSPADRNIVVNCYQNVSGKNDEESIELLLFDAVGKLFDNEDFFNNEYQKSDVKLGHTYFLRTDSVNYKDIMIERFVFQVVPILREYVKDGILETMENLIDKENKVTDIAATLDAENRINMVSENIMLFVKNFGDENKDKIIIDNEYIKKFIEDLCTNLRY